MSGVPQYYFTDDNFPLLQKTNSFFAPYEEKQHKNNLRLFKGVLAASDNLATFYKQKKLHENVELFGIVRNPDRAPLTFSQRNGDALRIGCFGGGFRGKAVNTHILPALKELAKKLPVKFFARDDLESLREIFEAANIQFVTTKAVDDIDAFYTTWDGYDLDILVHPSGETENLPYKNANALLNSYYLSANPIVSDEPAFKGVGMSEGVTKVDGTPEGYLAAFERLINSHYRHEMLTRLEVYTKLAFDSGPNIAVLDRIQRELGIPE